MTAFAPPPCERGGGIPLCAHTPLVTVCLSCEFAAPLRGTASQSPRGPLCSPPPPVKAAPRRPGGPPPPARRRVCTCSLFPWYPSTAAVASTAPSADSAMTAYSCLARLQQLAAFRRSHVCHLTPSPVASRTPAPPGPVECGRPPTGGPVRSDSGKNRSVLPVMERGP